MYHVSVFGYRLKLDKLAICVGAFLVVCASQFLWVLPSVLGAAMGGWILWAMLRSPDAGMVGLWLSFIVIDPVRKIIAVMTGSWGGSGLLPTDLLLLGTFVSLYMRELVFLGKQRSVIRRMRVPPQLLLLIFGVALMILLSWTWAIHHHWLLKFASIRGYLLPVPALGLGWFFADRLVGRRYKRLFKGIFLCVSLVVAGAVLDFLVDLNLLGVWLAAALSPTEHAVHSWGYENVDLISSVFASSKRLGRFLLLTYPLLWLYFEHGKNRRMQTLSFFIIGAGCFVSGSREALLLFLFMNLMLARSRVLIIKLAFVLTCVCAVVLFLPQFEDINRRLDFSLDTSENWLFRIQYMTVYPLIKYYDQLPVELYLGIGAGCYGKPLRLIGMEPDSLLPPVPGAVMDSGLFKIIVEMGVGGLLAFAGLYGYLLLKAISGVRKKGSPLEAASGASIIVFLILLLKAHTMFDDLMAHSYFWFYVGGLIYSKDLKNKAAVSLLSRAPGARDPTHRVGKGQPRRTGSYRAPTVK